MSKLYIIGNGFDLTHKRKTRYTDFADFLKSNKAQNVQLTIKNFESKASNVYNCYMEKNDNLWSDIEHALDLMFQQEIIEDELEEYRKLNVSYIDDDFRSRDYHNQEISISDDYSFCYLFNEYLPKWINFVHQTPCDRLYFIPISSQDKFLCFNYTNTLEQTYDIPTEQILYIHGRWNDNNLIIGHNTPTNFPKETEDYLYEDIAGIRAFSSAHRSVYKNVEYLISKNDNFFKSLSSVDSVYILGHSISDIDIDYFIKVKNSVKNDAKWYISFYDNSDYEIKSERIKKLNIPASNVILDKIEQLLHNIE